MTFGGDVSNLATLSISPNALPSDYILYTSTQPATRPLRVSPAAIQAANENIIRTQSYSRPLNDQLWEILVHDAAGNRYNSPLKADAVLSLPYTDQDNDGIVDGTSPPVRVSTLAVWWLDEEHSLWVRLSNSQVNPADKKVTVAVRHFSVFAVIGAPSFYPGDAYAFPVPWRPSGGDESQTGAAAEGITFANLPSLCKVRIYNLSGGLVRELDHSDGYPTHKWDGRTDGGDDAPTGTYVYVIDSNTSRKKGKLVIIR
jgi:hypothetical protein